jgi:acyl carrier protein
MIKKIKKLVSESFEEDFEFDDIDKKFQDFEGWDSLTAMVLIDKLSEEFEINVEVDEINQMSVSSILGILNK